MRIRSNKLLSFIASVGVVTTAIASMEATIKAIEIKKDNENANKKEQTKKVILCYAPTVLLGISTIVCIYGSYAISNSMRKSVTGMYMLADQSYKRYKNKVKELYGEETHNKIVDAIMKDECKTTTVYAGGLLGNSSLDFDTITEKRTFYDECSNRFFESTFEQVIAAEYHINRNYTLSGSITLNELYNFLGLENIDWGDELGWDMSSGIYWIDFNHRKSILEDGSIVYVIEIPWGPTEDYSENYDYYDDYTRI